MSVLVHVFVSSVSYNYIFFDKETLVHVYCIKVDNYIRYKLYLYAVLMF